MSKIFISYSQEDFFERGRKVYNYLTNLFPNDDIFIDQAKPKGKEWRKENDEKFSACDIVILIITPSALVSFEVRREVMLANSLRKQIIPCKINDLKKDWNDLPWEIGKMDGIIFENDEELRTKLYGTLSEIKKENIDKKGSTVISEKYISVKTDKISYSDGEIIKINGTVSELLPNIPISMIVIAPDGNLVYISQIKITTEKTFSTEITSGGTLWKNAGNYTIKMNYGTQARTATIDFNFEGSHLQKSLASENAITVVGTEFSINYIIKGGNLLNAIKDEGFSLIVLALIAMDNGEITISLPRELLDAKIGQQDDDFFILNDGIETKFSEIKTELERSLTIPFSKDTKEIEIIGTPKILKEEIQEFKQYIPSEEKYDDVHIVTVSASVDRTVYPLTSVIYARSSINDILLNQPILFSIFDSKNRVLATKKIIPKTYKNLKLKKYGIYETKFKMLDLFWEVGETYTLVVTHGNAKGIDNFIIDQRSPVVQTDKSVYLWNSDMIITVIDPDADKDSNKVEFVGNRKDSLLTISTSEGEIKKYKLRETGDSTAIFQGIIGLIGVHDNEKVQGYSLGKKIIKKTQGHGIDDGFIRVKRGGKIIITYDNGYDIAELTAFSSNFGAALELDQKVYSWTDRIYFTVVAPDFNLNSNRIDVIGNNPENLITISTNIGKISKYKIKETGIDTGIFTGSFRLTGFKNTQFSKLISKKLGITKGTGPNSGLLSCNNDDTIEIKFNFGNEAIIGKALVRWNIGEIQWMNEIYSIDNVGIVRVIDPDMNFNPDRKDRFNIRVWSDSDKKGIKIPVIETGNATGIFEGQVIFNEDSLASKGSLFVKKGDQVIAEYEDWTLPSPYSIGDTLTISSKCKINFEEN